MFGWDGVFMLKLKVIKILICDDSLLIRKKLGESIKQCYSAVELLDARDGMEAIYLYRVHSPDLVFMDIIMPGKSGIEVVKEIKGINKDAQIVMVSSSGTKENLFKAYGAGSLDFIQKPWEQSCVEKILSKFIPEPEEEPEIESEKEVEKEEHRERISGFEITNHGWKDTIRKKK
jgi:two-component system, chemotaxis family, chemotaxis protein CheY